MSNRDTEPTYRLVDLHPDVDIDAARQAYAASGWFFVGRGALCQVDGVTYRRVSVRHVGRPSGVRAERRDPGQPYDVPPGWCSPLHPGSVGRDG